MVDSTIPLIHCGRVAQPQIRKHGLNVICAHTDVINLARCAQNRHGLALLHVSTVAGAGEAAKRNVTEDAAIDWSRLRYYPLRAYKTSSASHMANQLLG